MIYYFVVVSYTRVMNMRKTETSVEPVTRECPYCLGSIPAKATRCSFCTSEVPSAALRFASRSGRFCADSSPGPLSRNVSLCSNTGICLRHDAVIPRLTSRSPWENWCASRRSTPAIPNMYSFGG